MQEKKVFITKDGKEFSSKNSAIKHENKCSIVDKFFTNTSADDVTDKKVTEFVTSMSEHPLGWKIKPAITLHWSKWNDRELEMFINLAQRINDAGDKEMIKVKFFDCRRFPSRDLMKTFIVEKPQDSSMESLISVLNKEQIESIGISQDFNDKGNRTIAEFDESSSDEKNYIYHIKIEYMPISEKISHGIKLSESDLSELVFEDAIFEEDCGSGRWSTLKRTVVDIDGQYYVIEWWKGLTEMQEDMFSNQPVKCKLETKEVTVVKEVTTIVVEE